MFTKFLCLLLLTLTISSNVIHYHYHFGNDKNVAKKHAKDLTQSLQHKSSYDWECVFDCSE